MAAGTTQEGRGPQDDAHDGPARVLVVGVGSIGGVVLGGLLQQDRSALAEVVGLSSNAAVREAVAARGLRVRSASGDHEGPARVVAELPLNEPPFDYVLLATQPPQVEAAAREALPWLAAHGRMVVLQNGLCEDRVAAVVGADRVLGAVVGWGASTLGPAAYERTSEGAFVIGRMDGADDPAAPRLARLLESVAPAELSPSLAGARWSKLAINSAISTLGTLGGDTLGHLMPYLVVRRLALHIMTETVEVARAEGVKVQKLSGTFDLDWLALTPAEKAAVVGSPALLAKHALLLAVGARYRRLRSSMLAAIERGRPPAVDFLNGEVVSRGQRHGVPTPVNAATQAAVHGLARGECTSGMPLIRAVATSVGLQLGPFTGDADAMPPGR